jgi:hypothetical protein
MGRYYMSEKTWIESEKERATDTIVSLSQGLQTGECLQQKFQWSNSTTMGR